MKWSCVFKKILPKSPWRPQVTPEPTGSLSTFTDRNHDLQPITFSLRRAFISLPENTIVNRKAGINRFAKYDKRTPKEDKNLLPHHSGMLGDVGGYKRASRRVSNRRRLQAHHVVNPYLLNSPDLLAC
jgi:hypothetical protein